MGKGARQPQFQQHRCLKLGLPVPSRHPVGCKVPCPLAPWTILVHRMRFRRRWLPAQSQAQSRQCVLSEISDRRYRACRNHHRETSRPIHLAGVSCSWARGRCCLALGRDVRSDSGGGMRCRQELRGGCAQMASGGSSAAREVLLSTKKCPLRGSR